MGDYGTLKKALIKKALLISLAVACILLALIVALKLPSINFFATVGGIFAVKGAIFYHVLISNRHLSVQTEDSPS